MVGECQRTCSSRKCQKVKEDEIGPSGVQPAAVACANVQRSRGIWFPVCRHSARLTFCPLPLFFPLFLLSVPKLPSSSLPERPAPPPPSRPAGSITELPPRTFYRRNAAGASPMAPVRRVRSFRSAALGRTVRTELLLPPAALGSPVGAPVLYLNDGQDVDAVALPATLERLWSAGLLPPITVVAIHANADRLQEYGVGFAADFRGRGARAGQHARFVVEELRPWIDATYRPSTARAHTAIAGFSLGGLSALDIAWSYFDLFGTVGVLSGALWWRARDVRDPEYSDADRLMHQQLAGAPWRASSQRFWFQTGTQDETNDRNHNGIIDAIDDTLDALTILRQRGYPEEDLRYLEIPGGHHHQTTWAEALPDFLVWTFGMGVSRF